METWTLVSLTTLKHCSIALLAVALIGLSPFSSVEAKKEKKRQEIRLYKVNKDGITQRLRFTKRKSKRQGCQNLILKSRVFKISHFGFKHCIVYSKKDCEEGTEMQFSHPKVDDLQTVELAQGYAWQPIGEHKRGERMKSWMCIAE